MRERRAITVHGVVQGVGFRPFVFGLASRLGLCGCVRNQTGGVLIEVEGEPPALDAFLNELATRPPPLARIDRIRWERQPEQNARAFCIEGSVAGDTDAVFVGADSATCDDCLRELFDPADRRYRYPFLNCTNCGPRLTIVTGAPYDRARTTMAGFALCAACWAEYEDPGDRRFHAQPTCCPACGPQVRVCGPAGQPLSATDPIVYFAEEIRAGRIGALKGLGGYHLVCDARSAVAVAELRQRKRRDEKPLAVMVRDLTAAESLCEVNDTERRLLLSRRRPIVLLRKRQPAATAGAVAPGNPCLGVMLPYTPLHHLLLHTIGGQPLVMTSGNRSDEPIAYEDADAFERLRDIADLFLTHDRPIHVRCDDSVTRVIAGRELPLRRSRGEAPQPVPLPLDCPAPILAVGGQLKATFALGRGRHAFLSHHLGDLDHYEAYRAFTHDIGLYQELFAVVPALIAHDLHPDYASTRYARERLAQENLAGVAVQHHHAHMASCMAEHGLEGPVLGVTFDGTGYGTDGTVWGGEFLVGDYRQFQRVARLRCVGMPGGEAAVREPWRMALAHLVDAGLGTTVLERRLPKPTLANAQRLLERRFNTPLTSSAGRLFDGVAGIIGLRDRVRYEGQAAIELEWLATSVAVDGTYPFHVHEANDSGDRDLLLTVDTRPLIAAVARDTINAVEPARIARRFHSTVTALIVAVCDEVRRRRAVKVVALSGGVFCNALLLQEAREALQQGGFQVYTHRLVPPNDGGLSLGQLAVAAARLAQGDVDVPRHPG